ncbi:MAG: hypothetical protein EPN25_00440, partial [Nitrospirae bacterium]
MHARLNPGPGRLQQILSLDSLLFFLYIPLAVAVLLFFNSQAILNPDWLPVHDTLYQLTEFLY